MMEWIVNVSCLTHLILLISSCCCSFQPAIPNNYSSEVYYRPTIIGGVNAKVGEFPFLAALSTVNPQNVRIFFCGGIVLTKKVVLTAAHCFEGFWNNPQKITAHAGLHKLSDTQTNVQSVAVKKVVAHSGYVYKQNPFDIQNDTGIAVLNADLVYNTYVGPALIPTSNSNSFAGLKADVTGWGYYKQNPDTQPDVLQKVQQTVLTNQKCQSAYSPQPVRVNEMCAEERNKGICRGDSGGPLVTVRNNQKVVIGIVSWSKGCAIKPDVYVRVSMHYPWIKQMITANP